jgi:beta-galactosidase
MTTHAEVSLRLLIPFNHNWLFLPAEAAPDRPDQDFERVTLPHTTKLLPHHNFDVSEYAFVSTYRKRFTLPEPRAGRRVFIDFDGAMIASTVSINRHTFDEYRGGFTPFSFDLTDYLNEAGENLLTVRLDSTERRDIPPFGNLVDYLVFGGIYRDVTLRYVPVCHISDLFVRTFDALTALPVIEVHATLTNTGDQPAAGTVAIALTSIGDLAAPTRVENVSVAPHSTQTVILRFDGLPAMPLWTLENPALMTATASLKAEGNEDRCEVRFGLREARFDQDGSFYLNGQPLKLRGLNRHQTYPYIGAAAPARLQAKDADIIKFELGCNIVRTSHYPQSPYFLNRCDEIGLLVFEEIPGWQFIGADDWKAISLRDVRVMIERDRSHPSIVLWGVRINESWDDEAFYDDTNNLARRLDPTRQTGGVRFFIDSQFIEDVFTFNDFSKGVLEPKHTPHLITEFNGHMFPTKIWDQEERAVEHATRHALIQNLAAGNPRVSGAIGWCAFDYNTHREFGSGDRICYHGVSDIFRLPKFAAYFYESQISPSVRPVLRVASYWTMGDRSEGGINPLIVFSNCDEIEVFTGGERFGRFQPDRQHYAHLPHPPFVIGGLALLWGGQPFEDLRVVGYIGGEARIEQQIAGDGLPAALTLNADDTELTADGADMTRVVFKIVDRFGNRLPYTQSVVTVWLHGPGQLIGENPFPLMGGQGAIYVKSGYTPSPITVWASTTRLKALPVTIDLRRSG